MLRSTAAIEELVYGSAAWSQPVHKDGYVYYVYVARACHDRDKVYRFSAERHKELCERVKSDESQGLDKGFLRDCCEPYIVCAKVQ